MQGILANIGLKTLSEFLTAVEGGARKQKDGQAGSAIQKSVSWREQKARPG